MDTVQKIKGSDLSVSKYFETNDVPFSRVQYYKYLKIMKKYGEEGLRDKRGDGNYTKLTPRIKDYWKFFIAQAGNARNNKFFPDEYNTFNVQEKIYA
ncbi:MAG: hypothetical protein GY749_30320 [Desulfobacteraceae bacterium]|nr:hypothetical protein [Desulfobacteraceae bacterium]